MALWQCDFANYRLLVVGGTSGINQGVALAFAKLGAKVAVISRQAEKVAATVAALQAAGAADALGEAADVRDADAISAAIDRIAKAWGEFDGVVSGAAGNFPALASQMSPNGFRSVVEIDLLGTYHVMRAIYPHLARPGASVINISAPQAQVPMLAQAHVCAAKAGVDMITRTLACEWGSEGLRVNSVIPGPIAGTEGMARLAPTPALVAACVQSVPLKRMGSPDDIAQACLFLCSPFASYISGAVLPVDGGWLQGGAAAVAASFGQFVKKAN
jgi:NAD(P)-dependent dehydrogenase (short-subunit alcohol dehydrogenase family)